MPDSRYTRTARQHISIIILGMVLSCGATLVTYSFAAGNKTGVNDQKISDLQKQIDTNSSLNSTIIDNRTSIQVIQEHLKSIDENIKSIKDAQAQEQMTLQRILENRRRAGGS